MLSTSDCRIGIGLSFVPRKTDHARGFANEIPRPADQLIVFVEQVHVYDEIAGEKFSCRLAFLAALDFRDALRRHEHFENHVAHLLRLDPLLDVVAHLVFLAGKHVHDEPLIFWGENLGHISGRE